MRILRVGVIFLPLLLGLRTLPAQNPTFSKRIDIQAWTYPSQLVQLADGGFVITGFYSPDSVGNIQQLFILKTDESGIVLWAKSADLTVVPIRNTLSPTIGLTATHDGGFAVSIPIEPSYNSSFILAKFDSSGIKQWARQVDGVTSIVGADLIETSDHGFAIGYSGENITDGISKFDSTGNLQWSNGIFRLEFQPYHSAPLAQCADGSFVIGTNTHAKFSATGTLLWCQYDSLQQFSINIGMTKTSDGGSVICGFRQNNQFREDFYVIKYGSDGKKIWDYVINLFALSEAIAIHGTPNGDLVMTGMMSNSLSLMRLSTAGEGKFVTALGLASTTFGKAVIPTRDGGLAVIGVMYKGIDSGFDNQSYSTLFLKADSALKGCHLSNGLFSSSQGNAFLNSSYSKVDFGFTDTAAPALQFFPLQDVHEVDECLASSVTDQPSGKASISVFPDPVTSQEPVTLSLEGSIPAGPYEIVLKDLQGNTIRKIKITLSGNKRYIPFTLSDCAAGVYMIELRSESDATILCRTKCIKQ